LTRSTAEDAEASRHYVFEDLGQRGARTREDVVQELSLLKAASDEESDAETSRE
jgi:hypothetical protein